MLAAADGGPLDAEGGPGFSFSLKGHSAFQWPSWLQ